MLKCGVYFQILFFILCCASANPTNSSKDLISFTILHNNDMHSRYEQTSVDSGKCTPQEASANKCYGGFARVAHIVRKYRKLAADGGTPVLYLNAGDTYAGTVWFTFFKYNISVAFLNKLKPDAMSLGNHEFDENIEGLLPFLYNVEFPVLTANLNLTQVPQMERIENFVHSTVLNVKDRKVGVIGYLTPETKSLVSANPVEFLNEEESINAEAAKLKAQGINIIIALGHSGFRRDLQIAANCSEVDLVIGGHTNTFLYNGPPPSTEQVEGSYPTIVQQKSGKKVPVVQAYAYTKYLGKLDVKFDSEGNLVEFDGNPILLDSQVPQEEDMLQLLDAYRPAIIALEKDVVGKTKVRLEGRRRICRQSECNLGNLLADSYIFARILEDQGGIYWTDAAIAFVNAGGIRQSIEKPSDGSIFKIDILSVLPFQSELYVTKINGSTIRQALEYSAELHSKDDGGFLQMSGVHVTYDLSKQNGHFVKSIEVRCSDCKVPHYEELVDEKVYGVIVDSFLLDFGDGHCFLDQKNPKVERLTRNNRQALFAFLEKHYIVYPEIEGRIKFL